MLSLKISKVVASFLMVILVLVPFTGFEQPVTINTDEDLVEAGSLVTDKTHAPIALNRNAVKFVRNYLRNNGEELASIRERSKKPFSTIDRVFTQYKLPVELKYLAVVESELKNTAVSKVGAVGAWQLMPATAKILGLKVNAGLDERRHFDKSTKAAAIYLRDLYAELGDWLLVMAAYNCGPGPVYTAIHKAHTTNFWALQNYLPQESRDHVKKFIATHYYFEGNGSVTTLTRAENIRYELNKELLAKQ
jgi:membrane-bound lytic murein transglycosylase D